MPLPDSTPRPGLRANEGQTVEILWIARDGTRLVQEVTMPRVTDPAARAATGWGDRREKSD